MDVGQIITTQNWQLIIQNVQFCNCIGAQIWPIPTQQPCAYQTSWRFWLWTSMKTRYFKSSLYRIGCNWDRRFWSTPIFFHILSMVSTTVLALPCCILLTIAGFQDQNMCYRSFGNGIFGSRDAQAVKPNKGMGAATNNHPYKFDNW